LARNINKFFSHLNWQTASNQSLLAFLLFHSHGSGSCARNLFIARESKGLNGGSG
jgi:hypothetical protein